MAVTTLRIKVGEQWYTVEIGDLNQSPLEVTVEGETFYVEIEGLAPPPPAPRRGRPSQRQITPPVSPTQGRSAPSSSSDKILRSPMPGRVISIMVRPGDRVSPGDEVCVVEAMKMEQSIRAVQEGVVKTIHVQPMDSVSASDPLIELE
ncbi:MAG: biotin/lipoyl-containing protein [Dehalococcoidia bacterium]